jgi:B12-binding domain/radical SAM domain protein
VSRPFEIALRLSRDNRSSVAAVLALIEAELPPSSVQARVAETLEQARGADLVGWSFATARRDAVARELEQLSTGAERPLTLAGGPHASALAEQTLALGFDWVAPGEAGAPLVTLLRRLAQGEAPQRGVLAIAPALELDRYDPWPRSGALFCRLEITRGCSQRCTFCQTPRLHGGQPRHRSIGRIRELLGQAVATGHTFTRFVTPNAFGYGAEHPRRVQPRRVEALLAAARDSGMRQIFFGCFPSEVRPESVTDELLGLTRAHCANDHIVVGLQSGSDAELLRLRRGHTVAEGLTAVGRIARAGLRPVVDFIFGLPEQSDADRAATRELIAHLADHYGATINAHRFTPLPGTPLAQARPSQVDHATRGLMRQLINGGHALPPRESRVTRRL